MDDPPAPEFALDRVQAVQQAAWAVREDVPPPPEFVSWYRSMDQLSQESVESDVLIAFEADRRRPSATRGGVERLDGRAPAWLGGAQRACARYLATQVRYVGPLRQAPHRPFGTAPDPDAGDVGVAGQYVAAVMQANRSLKRRFPLPPNPSMGRDDTVTTLEAVNRWLGFLDLATSLAIREDTPLVLGIDVVPPGLGKAVPLRIVAVSVSARSFPSSSSAWSPAPGRWSCSNNRSFTSTRPAQRRRGLPPGLHVLGPEHRRGVTQRVSRPPPAAPHRRRPSDTLRSQVSILFSRSGIRAGRRDTGMWSSPPPAVSSSGLRGSSTRGRTKRINS